MPENKQYAQQIHERSKELFYKYEPYFNRRDGKPGWQWQFLATANDYSGRIAIGGNRIGKSDQGAYECVLAVTGKHPYRKFPRKGKGWIIGLDYNMVRDVNLPKFKKLLPRNFTINSTFNKSDNIWYITGEGREWIIQFKSSDSGPAKFQGDAVDFIWFDEEPYKTDIFNECMMRLIDSAGIWWMTATPVNGTAWLKAKTEEPDIFVTSGAMWDNPYIPIEEVKKKSDKLPEDEQLVRIEGKYIVFGGNPVFNIRLLNKMMQDIKHDIPVSIGTLRKEGQRNYRFVIGEPEDKHRADLVSIWQHPEPDTKYTIGLDAATGFGADYTSIQVWSNRLPFELVAWLCNKRISTVVGSEVLLGLARYYNNAFIVPETRLPGNAYVDNLIEYAYGNIYQKRQTLDESPSTSSKYGICTTETDKALLIDNYKELAEGIDGPRIIFHDEQTIYEFCNFVYIDDKRKTGAGAGFFDDRVMAAMLALLGCSLRPQRPREIKEEYNIREEDTAHHVYLMKRHIQRISGRKEEVVRV